MEGSELTVVNPGELYRQATDVAGLCKSIVLRKAVLIQGRRYVPVEPWMAIATAHGCVASSKDVERVEGVGDMVGGFKARGEIRKISNGDLISEAEGFVGEDEPAWFGGESESWDKATRKMVKKTLPKRPDFAIRAMAQTRAISRACRSAFAHVVVLIDSDLMTVPAEEVGHDDAQTFDQTVTPAAEKPTGRDGEEPIDWKGEVCTYGKLTGPLRGKRLGSLSPSNLEFLHQKFVVSGQEVEAKDRKMAAALKEWFDERGAAS